jgi:prepilin signal peptidase PulO-like enzyme (type II secretory pathway)
MRRRLRKALPFLTAIFLGTMAAALIAGIAMLAAHS